jgi:arylsulfatase A-like enzyme
MRRDRPNLVLFMPDQLRADCLGCFGNPVARTPNIDALAARGTRFANAYANHPVCGPSRVSLMTGWYPHVRGHRTLTHLLRPREPNLLRLLKQAGYTVAWAGARGDTFAPGVTEESTHFCGFTVRPTWLGQKPRYPEGSRLFDAYYNGKRDAPGVCLDFDEAAIQTALAFLGERPREPFVLLIALVFPHLPFEVEEPWYSSHRPSEMPARVPAEQTRGKPQFHAALRERHGTDRLSEEDWAEIARTYYGMIARVDHQLGRIMHGVERIGAAEHTAWFFFTDHGEYLGDYGLVEKWPSGLERCLLWNPLIAAVPGAPEGQVAGSFVEMVDLLPTLLELAGTEARHTHFGRSFVPLLHDPRAMLRDAAFSEGGFHVADVALFEPPVEGFYRSKTSLQRERPELVGKAISLRTERHTYVYRLFEPDELYDRAADPQETRNLLAAPGHQEVGRACRDRILDWLAATSDVIPWEPDPRFPKIPHGWHERP